MATSILGVGLLILNGAAPGRSATASPRGSAWRFPHVRFAYLAFVPVRDRVFG